MCSSDLRACAFRQLSDSKMTVKLEDHKKMNIDLLDQHGNGAKVECGKVDDLPVSMPVKLDQLDFTITVKQLEPGARDEKCLNAECVLEPTSMPIEVDHDHESSHSSTYNPMTAFDYAIYKHCSSGGKVVHCGRW